MRIDSTPEAMAATIARAEGTEALLPVITKEIYHYAILSSMREDGYLDSLVFQGGTSLRLCHGSPRYSEDLDFAGGSDFSLETFTRMGASIEHALSRFAPDSNVTVHAPRNGGMVNRWRIRIRTALHTKDMPSQIIKLEVAAVPSYDPEPSIAQVNYSQLRSVFDPIPIRVESIGEIMADKMLSYVAAGHTRYRDLWDMGWMGAGRIADKPKVWEMLGMKQGDYGETPDWHHALDTDRDIQRVMQSASFHDELTRFIEPGALARTLDDPLWVQATARSLNSLYDEYVDHLQSMGITGDLTAPRLEADDGFTL